MTLADGHARKLKNREEIENSGRGTLILIPQ
jgi:hypothetical protein